jgi:ATP-dependent protease HslVU (ClpYQ) ATPase subunit
MKPRIRLENANFAYQFTDNHQKYGNVGYVATNVETILHQRTDWAVAMIVKVFVMVLGNRE